MSAPLSPAPVVVPPAPGSNPVAGTEEPLPLWRKALSPLSSLRLTVVLLAFSVLVVFFGTLAQTEDGLYLAQNRYFRSWFSTWSPLTEGWRWIVIPLPGGYLLGTLLLTNLVAAHATRFKFTWKKSGILLSHLGVVLLLVGQLFTDMLARESRMTFSEGEWRNYSEDFTASELAILSDAPDNGMAEVVAIPEGRLRAGEIIRQERLPFTVRVSQWLPNSEPIFRAPRATNGPPQSSSPVSKRFDFISVAETHKMDEKNIPTVLIELMDTGGKSLGSWALSVWSGDPAMAKSARTSWYRRFNRGDTSGDDSQARMMAGQLHAFLTEDQTVTVNNRTYTLALRPRRYYQPFTLQLLKTTHEVYRGTDIPKNFQSRVLIDHPARGERREVNIYMNNPLRHGGLTYFQYQMGRDEFFSTPVAHSVLQVVQNPSWLTPYIGCALVAGGLLVQFGIHLVQFVRRRVTT